jgi:hypothetical protein
VGGLGSRYGILAVPAARPVAPQFREPRDIALKTLFTLSIAAFACALVPAQVLVVDPAPTRSPSELEARIEFTVKNFGRNAARLTQGAREARSRAGLYDRSVPFSLPVSVRVAGQPAGSSRSPGPRSSDLLLQFDGAGARAFPPSYQALLQDVFDAARPAMNTVFGLPSVGGTVRVRNYDADIGDRDAVAGGYFVPDNGSGQMEIRFPIYSNDEATAVNFIHTLLLAYLGPHSYGSDGFQEGLVRAATMRIARTPGAIPAALDRNAVERVLDNVYDVGPHYDWYNQRALGGRRFIAPNLRDTLLPPGGSTGGIYLLRYQMAGSAWQKVLVEYPAFAAGMNARLYAQPSIGGNPGALADAAQATLNQLAGSGGATIEGRTFPHWMRRQFILEAADTRGPKLLLEPLPITNDLAGSDFGVFAIQAHYFETLAGGNETLLSGTSYPIFWEPDFNRIFPSAQEDRMDIAGAYGSVSPNLPNLFGGQPYRAAVDVPVRDRIARAYLPAGAIATASNPVERDVFGTVVGAPLQTGDTLAVRLVVNGTPLPAIPVTHGGFGAVVAHQPFHGNARVVVEVVRTRAGSPTVLLARQVNKGPGPLALDLRVGGEGTFVFTGGLPRGMSMIGLPVDPFASLPSDLFGVAPGALLAARYNPARAFYELFPDLGPLVLGDGAFVRMPASVPSFSVEGRLSAGVPTAVALRPGWNMIANPHPLGVPTSAVRVIRASEFPKTYAEARGVDLGTEFFEFVPGLNDPHSGAPETGTFAAAANFQPGKGYFVRVLAPEGVTLLFNPPAGLAPDGGGRSRGVLQMDGDVLVREMAAQGAGWRYRISLVTSGHRADAFFGQTATATRGFDPREDSGAPPSIGGMQVVLEGGIDRLHTDVRRLGQSERYRIRLEGLQPGRRYALHFTPEAGLLSPFVGRDLTTRKLFQIPRRGQYLFAARATTHVIEIQLGAGR